MGLLAGWPYYSDITVANGSADYQTKITVYYGSGTNGLGVVYCNSLCQADFDDLRFTAADGTTLLDYWIESYVASTSAVVHVQNNSTPDTTLRMYYGKADAEAVSSGPNTFIQYHGAASASFHDADVTPTTGGLRFGCSARAPNHVQSNALYGLGSDGYTLTDDAVVSQFYITDNLRYAYSFNNGANTVVSETPHICDNTYKRLEILVLFGTSVKGFVDANQIGGDITTNLPNEAMGLIHYNAGLQASDQLWSFVGKYAATEPTFTFGSQQVSFQPFRSVYPHILPH